MIFKRNLIEKQKICIEKLIRSNFLCGAAASLQALPAQVRLVSGRQRHPPDTKRRQQKDEMPGAPRAHRALSLFENLIRKDPKKHVFF